MIHRVRRIGVAQLAKTMGVLDLLIGLVFAVCFFIFASMMPKGQLGQAFPMGGMAMLIFLPLLYGFFGYVIGALIAWLYNLVAGWVGGVELDLEPVEPSATV
jgi:ribose/xylose/arabinose/galactoside ABC-type transport system permease subunit